MSLVSKYKISISDALVAVGVFILLGVLLFMDKSARIPSFVGLLFIAVGYFWERFFTQRA